MKFKKGIMVKFIASLILAIIIFTPAIYLSAKLFRTSEQAKDNFIDFTKELDTFVSEKSAGGRGSTLLIMDKETALVYYVKGNVPVTVDVDAKGTDFSLIIKKPNTCKDEKTCLCLLRKSEFEVERLNGKITVSPKRFLCKNLDYDMSIETCSIGEPQLVNGYTCQDGFMIERNLVAGSHLGSLSYYETHRRSTLYLIKEQHGVKVVGT